LYCYIKKKNLYYSNDNLMRITTVNNGKQKILASWNMYDQLKVYIYTHIKHISYTVTMSK